MAEGSVIKLSGVIFTAANHPDHGVDEWDVSGERMLRLNFSWCDDPIGIAHLTVRENGDLWCDAHLVVIDDVDPMPGINLLMMCDAWSVGYSRRGEHHVTGTMVTPSLIQLPAHRRGEPVFRVEPDRYRVELRVPRVLLREVNKPPLSSYTTLPIDTFEVGLSPHGDLVPMDHGITALPDDEVRRLIIEKRVRSRL